jgi:hypothetical protein
MNDEYAEMQGRTLNWAFNRHFGAFPLLKFFSNFQTTPQGLSGDEAQNLPLTRRSLPQGAREL